jgi:hypothetical protein
MQNEVVLHFFYQESIIKQLLKIFIYPKILTSIAAPNSINCLALL